MRPPDPVVRTARKLGICRAPTPTAEKQTRVDFNAPKSLVKRADSVVEILDISRTRLPLEALEDELEELANDEELRRRLIDAYYDGRVNYDTVEAILGRQLLGIKPEACQ